MPNLVPPVTTSALAMAYKQRIEGAVPDAYRGSFTPLMTMYLTDNTTPEDVREAKERGVVAFKMYPAGATTNSDSGVTDWKKCVETLKAMEAVRREYKTRQSTRRTQAASLFRNRATISPHVVAFPFRGDTTTRVLRGKSFPVQSPVAAGDEISVSSSPVRTRRTRTSLTHTYIYTHMLQVDMPLLVHGEVTDPSIDFFDREAVFIERILKPLLDTLPDLRVVMEHITTKQAAEFVASAPRNVAASITPQHILWNRNSLFVGGLRPHAFCLPILKRETHREAVAAAAMSDTRKFFLGTDSAPHPKGAKESACGCAGIFSAPVALPLYAHAFEQAGKLDALEGFASLNGPDFYKLPRNEGTVTLVKEAWTVPESYEFGENVVIPMWSGLACPWRVV